MNPSVTPAALAAVLQQVIDRWPDAVLERSPVGELNVIADDRWVAIVLLMAGELFIVGEGDDDGDEP